MSRPHVPWRPGQVAALMIALGGRESFDKWNNSLPPRLRSEPEIPQPVDTVALSAAEEKRARKAAKRLKEQTRV